MTVGDRIKHIREEKGISQEELAKKLGLKDKSSVCKIEKAGDNISTNSIRKYADALNTTVARLMGWAKDDNMTDFLVRMEDQGMKIVLEDQKKLGTAGLALRIALYNMSKSEIQNLYNVAKIMSPHAFSEGENYEKS